MKEYPKIHTVFKRDSEKNHKTLLLGDYSIPEFEYLKNNLWIFTEKVDGTNIRIIWNKDQITFGGKTDNAQIPALLIKYLNDKFLPLIADFKNIFTDTNEVCLFGEGYGAKIQKGGGNYRSDQSFVLFDVKIGEWWLQRKDVEDIAKKFSVDIVPIIGEGTLEKMVDIIQSGELKSQWGNFIAEGIVARPKIELKTRNNQRIITKLKYKDFFKI